jgi:hypothetical protein
MTENLVLKMETTIPLQTGLTVKDLIEILQMVPDQNATISGKHTVGDRFSYGDTYRLQLNWSKVVKKNGTS